MQVFINTALNFLVRKWHLNGSRKMPCSKMLFLLPTLSDKQIFFSLFLTFIKGSRLAVYVNTQQNTLCAFFIEEERKYAYVVYPALCAGGTLLHLFFLLQPLSTPKVTAPKGSRVKLGRKKEEGKRKKRKEEVWRACPGALRRGYFNFLYVIPLCEKCIVYIYNFYYYRVLGCEFIYIYII